MCGRYALATSRQQRADLFRLAGGPELPRRYNGAPTQPVPVVRAAGDSRALALARGGLIPHWATDPDIGNRLINARSETVAEKPSFRDAFRKRRCRIPATGFYERLATAGGKQPFHFRLLDSRPFAFAGLWERWDKGEETIESCTLLTTAANAVVHPVHERLPVILRPEDLAAWLEPLGRLAGLQAPLRPYPAEDMEARAVSRRVNNPRHEGADCLAPAG